MTNFLGVDIGATGAIAILTDSGELVDVHEMPCLHDGPAGRRTVNALAGIVFASHAAKAFVESVNARPGEGAVGAFAFGRSRVWRRRGGFSSSWPSLLVYHASVMEARRRHAART